ncbi:myosin-binding striated muscle assembly central domain-containing protein [Ditylenchus destructor]|nr:myosin-binding striated muscle assembly central domain-containing protein [Ditylenchus destructor]
MATSGDSLEQSIAAELIILSVSKKERATAIIKTGLPALKMLYNSSDQNVKVRALAEPSSTKSPPRTFAAPTTLDGCGAKRCETGG